jgi:rhodanese-related sulfurtransferase/ferredoxin
MDGRMPTVYFFYQRKKVRCETGETIKDVAEKHNIKINADLVRNPSCLLGFCRSCLVRAIQTNHLSSPPWNERILLLRNPIRQACKARILDDVTVWTQGDFPTRLPLSPEEIADDGETVLAEEDPIVEEITPEAVHALMEQDTPIRLIDVREPREYDIARIEGAELIPLGQLSQRLSELNPEDDIIVHCHHGMRSHAAAQMLLSSGFKKVRNMRGGIDGWSLKVDFSVPRY